MAGLILFNQLTYFPMQLWLQEVFVQLGLSLQAVFLHSCFVHCFFGAFLSPPANAIPDNSIMAMMPENIFFILLIIIIWICLLFMRKQIPGVASNQPGTLQRYYPFWWSFCYQVSERYWKYKRGGVLLHTGTANRRQTGCRYSRGHNRRLRALVIFPFYDNFWSCNNRFGERMPLPAADNRPAKAGL